MNSTDTVNIQFYVTQGQLKNSKKGANHRSITINVEPMMTLLGLEDHPSKKTPILFDVKTSKGTVTMRITDVNLWPTRLDKKQISQVFNPIWENGGGEIEVSNVRKGTPVKVKGKTRVVSKGKISL